MAKSPIESLSPDEGREALRSLLLQLTRQIDHAILAMAEGVGVNNAEQLEADRQLVQTVLLMVQGVGVSIHSITKLISELDMGIRDCFGITRSVCEGSINVAYIIAGGPQIAARARMHTMQKTYRELTRETVVSGVVIKAGKIPPPEAIPGMAEALAVFTRKNGAEVTDWAPISLLEKQEVIREAFPGTDIVVGATSGLYRNASEILHGTLYGVQYFWTAGFGGEFSKEEFSKLYVSNHLVAIFTSVWAATHTMLEVIGARYDVPALATMRREWLEQAKNLIIPAP